MFFSIEIHKESFFELEEKQSDDKLEFKRRLSRGEDIHWSSVAEEQTLLSVPS